MNIIQQKLLFFQDVSRFAKKQTQRLFIFGLEVFTLKPIQSLRANARLSSFPGAGQDEGLPALRQDQRYRNLSGY